MPISSSPLAFAVVHTMHAVPKTYSTVDENLNLNT